MSTFITKCIIILAILSVAVSPQILINGQQQVSCFFSFGDGLSDAGNNNNLITQIKAYYLPYGNDFFYGPSGRFTNGMHIPDFIAQSIGSSRLPPFASAGGSNAILRGVNYASGSAGILDETSLQLGQRVPMNQQLSNHQSTVNQISTILKNQTAANNLLQKCLYTITMGNSDYINNYYYHPITLTSILYTPETFANKLIQQYSQQLTTLYNLQARKVAVFSVIPLGCIPQALSVFSSKGSACVELINDAVQLFNSKLINLIIHLNANLPGANFTYINLYSFLSADLTTILGIKVPNAPCCQINKLLGLCVRNGNLCSNRDEYTYFDNYHPTQIVANYSASTAYIAQSPSDAIPIDIRTLIQQ